MNMPIKATLKLDPQFDVQFGTIYSGDVIEFPKLDPLVTGYGTIVKEVFTTFDNQGQTLYSVVMDDLGFVRVVYRDNNGRIHETWVQG
jgi:hypothetical protein